MERLPVGRPTVACEKANDLGAMARVGTDRAAGIGRRVEEADTGHNEPGEHDDARRGQVRRREKNLAEGQRTCEDHRRASLFVVAVHLVTGKRITSGLRRKQAPFFLLVPLSIRSAQLQSLRFGEGGGGRGASHSYVLAGSPAATSSPSR